MRSVRRNSGVALITAVLLLTVLVAIGLALATVSKVEHDTGRKSLLSAKVYLGAKAGLDWGIQQAVAASACAASASLALVETGLSGVSVIVSCESSNFSGSNDVYYLKSTASVGTVGAHDYAERRLEATVSNIP
jgi:MSHA biogenesis protein MshP